MVEEDPRTRMATTSQKAPAKPKVGIRASKPNEIWHVDASVIRLLDGTKFHISAVIDNFSRRILAWRVREKLDPLTTVAIIREAAAGIGITPDLVADSGIENVNGDVDALVRDGVITRTLALVEVTYSNSIIEAYWRSLKHQWLFLNSLDAFADLAGRFCAPFFAACRGGPLPLRGGTCVGQQTATPWGWRLLPAASLSLMGSASPWTGIGEDGEDRTNGHDDRKRDEDFVGAALRLRQNELMDTYSFEKVLDAVVRLSRLPLAHSDRERSSLACHSCRRSHSSIRNTISEPTRFSVRLAKAASWLTRPGAGATLA